MFDELLDDTIEELEDEKGVAIGIDLGTTNSVVAAVHEGELKVLQNDQGSALHPSIVGWMPDGRRVVGQDARERLLNDPQNTIYSAKRIIGNPFNAPRVQLALNQFPFTVVEGPNGEPLVQTRTGTFECQQISGFILAELRLLAERRLKNSVSECVITVPANFSDGQRDATRQAARHAGLRVMRILNEPTAAAVAYGRNRPMHQRIAVVDLGGGTFDITVLSVRGEVFEVVATGGDPFLGGDDFDNVLGEELRTQCIRQHNSDPRGDPTAFARIKAAAEHIKIKLSDELVVEGNLQGIGYGLGGQRLDLGFRIERSQFEQLIEPTIESALKVIEQVLHSAELHPNQIDEVILVGGSTRVPLFRHRIAELFSQEPRSELNPMEVVAMGAAVHAGGLSGVAVAPVLFDVTSHSLRVATVGGYTKVLVPKNLTLPAEGVSTFFTARDNQGEVRLRVCQGEEEQFDENVPLGEVALSSLPEGRRGDVAIEVAFTIDADGLLQVAAKELSTGQVTRATLSKVGLSEET